MWEKGLIFMLIYLGIFFIIPDKFRSRKYLPVTLCIGILGACLGLYGIWKTNQTSENFGAGIGEACGPSLIRCGSAMKEVFYVSEQGGNSPGSYTSIAEANQGCIDIGADGLATEAQLREAQGAGAQWCVWAWVQNGTKGYPMQDNTCDGRGTNIRTPEIGGRGANCYGYKPSKNDAKGSKTRPFSDKTNAVLWSQSGLSYCHVNEKTLLNEQLDQSVEFNIFGRYVRVLAAASKGDGYINISQVMVYDLNGTNIALNKSTSAISTHPQAGPPSILVDGTTTPRGWPTLWHNDVNTRNDWWQVDLGSVQMITRVRIIQRTIPSTETDQVRRIITDRIEGMRIRVLKTTDEPATDGTCVIPPTPIYPAGTTDIEKVKIGDMILSGIDGQKALNVLKGIQASTATSLTNYGLTDSQAAEAYNKLYLENLNIRRAGWQFTASWTPGTPTLTVTDGIPPRVNMTIKKARGIPLGTTVIAVSENTVTLNRPTDAATGYGKYVLPTGAVDQTIQTKEYKGRYVRLRPSLVSGDGYVQVSQVVIKDASGTNIARGKPVFTTSVYCNGGSCYQQGSATVDGVLTPRAGSGAWQPMTGNRTTEYMEVDLGSVVAISSIQVQGRPDCCNGIHGNDRMTGMRIEINQTARAADTAAPTIANQPVAMNGDINDTTYFSMANAIRSVTTVASIQYDKAAELAYYMKFNKKDIQVPVLDSTGNQILDPVLDSKGEPVPVTVLDSTGNSVSNQARKPRFNKIADNGETAATNIIMSVTKLKAVDPNASASSATKATTKSAEGVDGYNVPAPPNTSDWSANSLNELPQQPTAINLGDQTPIEVDPTTSDEVINAEIKKKAFNVTPLPISSALMNAAAEGATGEYTVPRQSESGVAGVSGGAQKEVFYAGEQGGYSPYSYNSVAEANQGCINIGADGLATEAQLRAAQAAGAQWCVWAWLQNGTKGYPMQDNTCDGRGTNILSGPRTVASSGANCYGYKPSKNDAKGYKTRPFNDQEKNESWNQKFKIDTSACGRTPQGVQTVKRTCGTQVLCVDPAKSSCAQGCPPGTTKGQNGLCGTTPPNSSTRFEDSQMWQQLTQAERDGYTAEVKASERVQLSGFRSSTVNRYCETACEDKKLEVKTKAAILLRGRGALPPRGSATPEDYEVWTMLTQDERNTLHAEVKESEYKSYVRGVLNSQFCANACEDKKQEVKVKALNLLRGRGAIPPRDPSSRIEDYEAWMLLTQAERDALRAEVEASKEYPPHRGAPLTCMKKCEDKKQAIKLKAFDVLQARGVAIK